MPELPLISVLVITYNGAAYIQRQIDTILQQTYTHIEVVIADDASTDNTVALLQNLYGNLPHVRIIANEQNVGYIKNFENALAYCKGTYICFSDQDDIWLMHKIATLYAHIGDKMLVYSDSLMVNEHEESIGKKLSDVSNMYTGSDTRGFILWNVVWGHTMMVHRSLLDYSLPIPAYTPHDIWLAFRACTLGGIVYVDEVLTHYRRHTGNVTVTPIVKAKNEKSRPYSQRYQEYLEKLNWIELGVAYDTQLRAFYTRLLYLFKQKEKGWFVWPLFFFLVAHRKALFRFRNKKWISQILELRKQSRGERKD
jgi:glycosyltransferase involved in cell wall biosynthesis